MYTLKEWKVEAHHGKMIVWGKVYGHDKYPDGLSLHTSMIQEIDMDDRNILFSTKNSVYRCPLSAHVITVKDVQAFDQLPDDVFACDRKQVKKNIIDAVSAGLNAVANELASFMKDVSGDYTLIILDTDADYYFRWMLQIRDGKKYLVPQTGVAIREGSVQDSVLIGNGVKGQVMKFFPFADNRLTFYEWEEAWEPVYFLNAGQKDIRLECGMGSFVLKAGERICPSAHSERVPDALSGLGGGENKAEGPATQNQEPLQKEESSAEDMKSAQEEQPSAQDSESEKKNESDGQNPETEEQAQPAGGTVESPEMSAEDFLAGLGTSQTTQQS